MVVKAHDMTARIEPLKLSDEMLRTTESAEKSTANGRNSRPRARTPTSAKAPPRSPVITPALDAVLAATVASPSWGAGNVASGRTTPHMGHTGANEEISFLQSAHLTSAKSTSVSGPGDSGHTLPIQEKHPIEGSGSGDGPIDHLIIALPQPAPGQYRAAPGTGKSTLPP